VSGCHSASSFGDDDSMDKNSANTSKTAAMAPANIERSHLLVFLSATGGPERYAHSPNANTKRLLAALGFKSGASRFNPPLASELPVLTATYCFPATEYVTG